MYTKTPGHQRAAWRSCAARFDVLNGRGTRQGVRAALGGGFLMLALAAAVSAEDAGTLRVELREDRLTLQAREAPIERVLARFGDHLGIDVRGHPAESRRVTAHFEAVPVAEALHRLLDRESFTLTYAANGGLRSIALHGRLREPPSEHVSAAAPQAVAPPQPPQPVVAPGADSAGTSLVVPQPTLSTLLQETSPEQRVALRAAAGRAVLDAIVQNEGFLERLRANTGEGPEEFLARLAANAPSEDERAAAAAALDDLHKRLAGQGSSPGPPVAEGSAERHDRRRRRTRGASTRTPGPPSAMPGR